MEYRFLEQLSPEYITMRDVIELYNCEDRSMNGTYMVGDVDDDGDVTLLGLDDKSGFITVISFGDGGEVCEDED